MTETSDKGKRTLAQLEGDYVEACMRLRDAQREESIARNSCCSALNAANFLQREINERLATMRTDAPIDTDWKRSRGEPV